MDYRFWTIGLLVGAIVGFSKSGMPGLGVIAVPLLILLFDAKAAVGVITPICICGDIMSLIRYRRHADWSTLWRLLPGILIGMGMRDDIDIHLDELVSLKVTSASSTNAERDVCDKRHRQDDANVENHRRRYHRPLRIHKKIYPKDPDLNKVSMAGTATIYPRGLAASRAPYTAPSC